MSKFSLQAQLKAQLPSTDTSFSTYVTERTYVRTTHLGSSLTLSIARENWHKYA